MWRGLVLASALLMVLGFLLASQATLGVALIASGCLVGILARIGQAAQYRREDMRRLGKP